MSSAGKTTSERTNILVIATSDKLAINVIRCLEMSGMAAHLMSSEKVVGARRSRYCASWVRAEAGLFDAPYNQAIAQINGYCRDKSIGIVLAVDVPAILMLSAIQNRLTPAIAFPLAKPDQVRLLNNKWSFGQFLRQNQLPTPDTLLIESMDQLERTSLAFPLVVKPLEMDDGAGVRILTSLDQVRAHMQQNHPAHQLPLLLQEFIPGADIDLSVLANHGEVAEWTIQKWLPNGVIEFVDDDQILSIGRKIIAAAKYHGVAHFDMRRDWRDGSIKVLECNPRFWATLRESMWNGTNFVECGVRLLGGKPMKQPHVNRHITYAFAFRSLASFFKGDFAALRSLSAESLRDAWNTFTDPLTWTYQLKNRLFSKAHFKSAGSGFRPSRAREKWPS